MLILNLFLIGFLNIVKTIKTLKACTCWDIKFVEDFRMGYETLKGNLDGL